MVIDLHAHYIPVQVLRDAKPNEEWRPRVYRDSAGKQWIEHAGKKLGSAPREFVDIAEILREQDKAGVDLVALSPWSSLFNYDQPLDVAMRSCRLQNEAIANAVREHPKRIAGIGCVPLQDANCAAQEVRYLIRDMNLRGIEVGSNVNGIYPGDPRMLSFWEAVAEADTFVFVHPVPGVGGAMMREFELWNLYGNPAEIGLAAASLIFNGVLEKLPNLKILLAHGGGVLPFIAGRLDQGWRNRPAASNAKITRAPSSYLKQFYFDTIVFSEDAIRYLFQFAGAEHIVIGSDYPFDMGYDTPREPIEKLGLPKEQAELVFNRNASRLLKI
jgi:aminocarboxymuconate-semialdehyde decarboxylase